MKYAMGSTRTHNQWIWQYDLDTLQNLDVHAVGVANVVHIRRLGLPYVDAVPVAVDFARAWVCI
jgi:hypothetical protein